MASEILYWMPPGAPDLARATPGASGYDLRAAEATPPILPSKIRRIGTGLHLAMPLGIEAQIRGRSGLLVMCGITCPLGSVDSDYRGEVGVPLVNLGDEPFEVEAGDRIAQLVFAPVFLPDAYDRALLHAIVPTGHTALCQDVRLRRVANLADLPASGRGTSGFGSTGTR